MSRSLGQRLLGLAAIFLLIAPPAAGEETVTVWLDDARTKKVTVPLLDAEAIAAESNLKLYLDVWHGFIGISAGWSRKSGIEYDRKARELIEKLEALCEEFNDGKLSLESYRRRLRAICAAEEKARQYRYEMMLNIRLQSLNARAAMDRAFGKPVDDLDEMKAAAEKALAVFIHDVESVPYRGELPGFVSTRINLSTDAAADAALEQRRSRKAATAGLADFSRSVDRSGRSIERGDDTITIWKDRARTVRITVPRLQLDDLLDDVTTSLTLRPRFSIFAVGPRMTWAQNETAEFNQAAQMLIVRYRQLCLEYNAGLVSQEEYNDRLQELFEAEDRARNAHGRMLDLLREDTLESLSQMDEELGGGGSDRGSASRDELEKLAGDRAGRWNKEQSEKATKRPSLVDRVSREHREQMALASVARFEEGVERMKGGKGDDTIEVLVNDRSTEKTTVSKLDAEILVQNVSTRLALHIYFFNFGPEIAWAKEKGIAYESAAQQLIIRYRQLCVEFNAGLVSLEAFDRRRRAIDAAIEKAAAVRTEFRRMAQMMSRDAVKEMKKHLDPGKRR